MFSKILRESFEFFAWIKHSIDSKVTLRIRVASQFAFLGRCYVINHFDQDHIDDFI